VWASAASDLRPRFNQSGSAILKLELYDFSTLATIAKRLVAKGFIVDFRRMAMPRACATNSRQAGDGNLRRFALV
jgi:hypothetical protein